MMLLPGSTVLLSWVASNLTQPAIKCASAIALINAICNAPNSKLKSPSPETLYKIGPVLANISLLHHNLDIVPLLLEATIPDSISRQSRRRRRHGHSHGD